MTPDRYHKLSQTISKGKWHYILMHGVIGWGIPTAVLFSIFQSYGDTTSFMQQIKPALLIFPLAGTAWGALMWSRINTQHQSSREK
ncbi:hypothetical protein [Shewanella marina]|uniref:hypothetical protein n=1 Tax=Shewanella marina TaxID=487319 RepID=UPI0011DD4303|nr:hypothetical protein [Shewanella marina]